MHYREYIIGRSTTLLCVIAGCAVGPNFSRPSALLDKHYVNGGDPTATTRADGTTQTFDQNAKLPADWWRLFNSPKVDAVVHEALIYNPGLQAAQASSPEPGLAAQRLWYFLSPGRRRV